MNNNGGNYNRSFGIYLLIGAALFFLFVIGLSMEIYGEAKNIYYLAYAMTIRKNDMIEVSESRFDSYYQNRYKQLDEYINVGSPLHPEKKQMRCSDFQDTFYQQQFDILETPHEWNNFWIVDHVTYTKGHECHLILSLSALAVSNNWEGQFYRHKVTNFFAK